MEIFFSINKYPFAASSSPVRTKGLTQVAVGPLILVGASPHRPGGDGKVSCVCEGVMVPPVAVASGTLLATLLPTQQVRTRIMGPLHIFILPGSAYFAGAALTQGLCVSAQGRPEPPGPPTSQ